jgi:hypothetical protein
MLVDPARPRGTTCRNLGAHKTGEALSELFNTESSGQEIVIDGGWGLGVAD